MNQSDKMDNETWNIKPIHTEREVGGDRDRARKRQADRHSLCTTGTLSLQEGLYTTTAVIVAMFDCLADGEGTGVGRGVQGHQRVSVMMMLWGLMSSDVGLTY